MQTGELLPTVGIAGVGLIVMLTDAAGEVQLLIVAVTVYNPLAAVVTFAIVGLAVFAVNPFGPPQANVAVPGDVVLASNVNILPLQIGALVVIVGVAGGVGSDKVIVPARTGELHPFSVTKILVYAPALNEVITISPLVFAVTLFNTVGAPPSLT